MRIGLVADTHVRASGRGPFPSDARAGARNRAARRLVAGAHVVVHLGDVVHPLEGAPGRAAALRAARALWGDALLAPGNHDVGDAPHFPPLVPRADAASHARWAAAWGAEPFRVLDADALRLVLLSAPLLGTGLPLEAEMRRLAERAVAAGGPPALLLLHVPPFLVDPDEPAAYDNLAPEPRRWLLGLLRRGRVAAIASGHVHVFHLARLGETWLLGLPAVAFARPEHAERHPLAPEAEAGRDAPHQLGVGVLEVAAGGVRLGLARLDDPDLRPFRRGVVGVDLSVPWCREAELPAADLDPLSRRRTRDDEPLRGLLEVGAAAVRLPADDLRLHPDRVAVLRALGLRVVAVSGPAAPPPDGADAWELAFAPGEEEAAARAAAASPVPVLAAPRRPLESPGHFSAIGLAPGEAPPGAPFAGAAWRVPGGADPWAAVAAAAERAPGSVVRVLLGRRSEGAPDPDERGAARRAALAACAAAAHPEVTVVLDGLLDKDRGYWPRLGLYRRDGRPRPAARVLRALLPLLARAERMERAAPGVLRVDGAELHLRPDGPGPWRDLETGRAAERAPAGPAIRGEET